MKLYVLSSMIIIAGAFSFSMSSCSSNADAKPTAVNEKDDASGYGPEWKPSDEWKAYWYKGLAEVSSYEIMQGRYYESHPGNAVNIFVTEDLSKERHVKLDIPSAAGKDRLPVLKLNQTIKFNTGIYPYSVMMSAFMPIDRKNYPHAAKVTSSIQDWCGMVFLQANSYDKKIELEQFSYFEGEGDSKATYTETFLEDELWTLIRIAPEQLPQGKMKVIPSTTYLRFSHKPILAYDAELSVEDKGTTKVLTINYPALQRRLDITFNAAFPYAITGWTEIYPGFGGTPLETKAVLKSSKMMDYWNLHRASDRALRKELGLPELYQ
ncbi:MAG: hypothetical protein ABR95_08315 [Sphingobacteriales bacterium BACL12 MAG-120813-bin55]|mgnify:CR=1 FL=1|jgi:hypothetical protein|nr:MAG: hypothetical protein ABR95_08315 [Sphingobacteriales bacterium BACL12 MAG-120813-bin55]